MAKINENILITNRWLKEIELNSKGDEELAAKRLWYLCLSAVDGEQVMSDDPQVDCFIPGYLGQISAMKNHSQESHTKRTRKEEDEIIREMRLEGKTCLEVAEVIYGNNNKASGDAIRGRVAWKNAGKEMAAKENAENSQKV